MLDPSAFEEATKLLRQRAAVLGDYRDNLIGAGFTREEAVRIVRDWSSNLDAPAPRGDDE